MFKILSLLLGLMFGNLSAAQAQIGLTRDQLVSRWKGGANEDTATPVAPRTDFFYPGGSVDFPHGNHGVGISLNYKIYIGLVCFEQWISDGNFSARAVLKQSEPGYHWTEREPTNWFGTAPGKPPLHAHYEDAYTNSRLYVAPLEIVPDKGEGGLEFWEYMLSPSPAR
jgi:hypothetical protein